MHYGTEGGGATQRHSATPVLPSATPAGGTHSWGGVQPPAALECWGRELRCCTAGQERWMPHATVHMCAAGCMRPCATGKKPHSLCFYYYDVCSVLSAATWIHSGVREDERGTCLCGQWIPARGCLRRPHLLVVSPFCLLYCCTRARKGSI